MPGLLGGLQGLPSILTRVYRAHLGARATDRLSRAFADEVVPSIGYTEDAIAEPLQAQLEPWLHELVESGDLLRAVTEALRGMPPAVQEALHWSFSYEAASGYLDLGEGIRRAEVHAAFVPFTCTGFENTAPASASPFAGVLAERTKTYGLVHPDELLLVVPFFLEAPALTNLQSLSALFREAWGIAAEAWGPGLVPSVQAQAHWEAQWAARPQARRWHAAPFAPGDVRFAMVVVISPELHHDLQVPLEPWQRLEREQMRLRERFAPDVHRVHSDDETLIEAATQARVSWAESLLETLMDVYPAMVGADPRDAYSACALAATHTAADLVGSAELAAEGDDPLVLLVDAAGMSVELGGRRRTVEWAPQGTLMPGMVRSLAVRLSRAVGREVSLSVALEQEGWALIQGDDSQEQRDG